MTELIVVARTFSAGAGEGPGEKKFDFDNFLERVAKPVRKLMTGKVVERIVMVVNAEQGNPLAEIVGNDGQTPSSSALIKTFCEEIETGRMDVLLCRKWGPNAGSGNALRFGLESGYKARADLVGMCWSPELEISTHQIEEALHFREKDNLFMTGFLRQNWWQKPQWHLPQNTGNILLLKPLKKVGWFSPECNGTGRTVTTKEFGKVLLAGMEDFHAMLKILKVYPNFCWGMVGRSSPLKWNTDFPAGSERLLNHLKKVARQELVMKEWVKMVFPRTSYEEVMNELFARYHQD